MMNLKLIIILCLNEHQIKNILKINLKTVIIIILDGRFNINI